MTANVAGACFVGTLGGLLFGFDLAVISGAIDDLQAFYALDANGKGWAAACALIGCMIGAATAGRLADAVGRKPVLLGTAVLFAISAVGSGWAERITPFAYPSDFHWFIFYRWIGGCAMGAAAGIAPIYVAEIGPARHRGTLVTFYQLAIVIGVITAQLSNYAIDVGLDRDQWRWMFTAEAPLAVLFFVALLAVPESPRWLAARGQHEKALAILSKTEGNGALAREEFSRIEASLAGERKSRLSDVLRPEMRLVMVIGLVFGIGSQMTGMTAVLTFAPSIFAQIGGRFASPLFQTVLLGCINFACTFIPLLLIDRVGRKKILFAGLGVMAVALTGLGVLAGSRAPSGPAVLVLLLVSIGAYAASIASVTWVMLSEIFPNRIRGVAMSVANLSLWFTAYLTTRFFPVVNEAFGLHVMFFLFAAVCVLIIAFVVAFVPETKGRSLEEIEQLLVKPRVTPFRR